jgi:hypothetical protein
MGEKQNYMPGVVAHTCNPRILGGRRMMRPRPAWATQQDPVRKEKERKDRMKGGRKERRG